MLKGSVGNDKLFELFQGGGSGEVAGVFSSAVYFSLSGKMCLLHDSSYGIIPFGIALPELAGRAEELGLAPDMKLSLESSVLSNKTAGFEIKLLFEREAVKPVAFDCLPAFACGAERMLKTHGHSALAAYCMGSVAQVDKNSIEDIFAKTAYKGLVELEMAMSNPRLESMTNALKKLLGLGRGLTPSLDDFICGMLYVLNYAGRTWSYKAPCLNELCRSVDELAGECTNAYSAAYLLAASAGEDFSLMRLCLENSLKEDAAYSIKKLMRVGASSGSDMLCGMCFAANYILKQRQVTL